MIDKAFDRAMRAMEILLAVALVFAVALNFANVIGRFLLQTSLIGSEEIQVFILIYIAFLGAAIATWRNEHLRVDVVVLRLPRVARNLLQAGELVVLAVLAGFVAFTSFNYARQMLVIGRNSDMIGLPMWIPHGAVSVGFALILVIALLKTIRWLHKDGADASARSSDA